jgi:hypothetical protein
MSSSVVEWAPFRLREGIEEPRLLQASEALQTEFLAKQRGFIHRELLKGENGQWVDLVYWTDHASADQAAKNAAESPVCFDYFHLMADHAEPGAGVMHFERVRLYQE